MKSMRVTHGRPAAEKWRKPVGYAGPEVPAFVERDDEAGQWRLIVSCPHCCGHRHDHGGGPVTGEPQYGDRLSHCFAAESQQYWLVPGPPGMAKPRVKSYGQRLKDILAFDRAQGRY